MIKSPRAKGDRKEVRNADLQLRVDLQLTVNNSSDITARFSPTCMAMSNLLEGPSHPSLFFRKKPSPRDLEPDPEYNIVVLGS